MRQRLKIFDSDTHLSPNAETESPISMLICASGCQSGRTVKFRFV